MRKKSRNLLCLALAALLSLSLLPTPAFAEEAETVEEIVVEKTEEHSWGEWIVTREPTCKEPGEQVRSCTDEDCDATDTQAIPVVDHTWGAWTVTREPTFAETGEREHTCSVCELTVKEEIPRLDSCKTLTYQFGTDGDALTVVVGGKFSQNDAALDLRGLNADEIEPLQTMLEEKLDRKVSSFRGVRLVDEKNVVTMLMQKDMSFSVGGSWLPESGAITFAILDEYGQIRIVEAEKVVPDDDGAVTYTFTAGVLNALLWAVAEAPAPAPAPEPSDVKTIDPSPVRVQSTPPTNREGEGDSIHTYTGKIILPFTKVWDDNNNALGLRPGSITVYLYRYTGTAYSSSDLFMTATVSAADGWKHDFEIVDTNDQHDAFNGNTPYNFAFAEAPITSYEENTALHDDPAVILTFGDSTNDDWTRITPNNTRDWNVETMTYPMNFVVIKEAQPHESESGHRTKFVVWTPDALSDYEKTLLLAYIKTHNSWNSETFDNTEWLTGIGSYYGGITITGGSPGHLHFDATSNWAYFAVGSYTRSTPEQYAGSITNRLETTGISVTKSWNDGGDCDGKRPTVAEFKAKVKLYADGTDVTSTYSDNLTVTDNGDNTYTITYTGLPKNANKTAITYTIGEDTIADYTAGSTDPVGNGGTITNTHTPEKITITGKKTWDDKNNQDGKRPTSITITLLANGKTQSVLIVTEKDGWAWSFSGMPKYENGKEIKYTITENPVKGYVSTVKGYNVTNTRTYEQLLPTGQLTWPIPVLGGLGLLFAGYGLLLLFRRRKNEKI